MYRHMLQDKEVLLARKCLLYFVYLVPHRKTISQVEGI